VKNTLREVIGIEKNKRKRKNKRTKTIDEQWNRKTNCCNKTISSIDK
jgi:hypothetical protein